MDGGIVLLIIAIIGVFAAGFGSGYGVREVISRHRRAEERARQMRKDTKRAQTAPPEVLSALRSGRPSN